MHNKVNHRGIEYGTTAEYQYIEHMVEEKVHESLKEHTKALESLGELLREMHISRAPIDTTDQISSTVPYIVNYFNRKHLFLWFPVAVTLSVEDYGTGPVQAQVWVNIGMPEGTRITAVGQSTILNFMIKATDEVIP